MGTKQSTSMMKCTVAFAALALVYVFAGDCTTKQYEIPAIAIRQEMCPASAPFFGFMGCAAALVFACLGAAYGTAKSGVGVANMGVLHSEMIMKSIIHILWLVCSASTVSSSLCSWAPELTARSHTTMLPTLATPRSLLACAAVWLVCLLVSPLASSVMLVSALTLVSLSSSSVLSSFLSSP